MRVFLAIMLAIALVAALAGCAEEKPKETKPVHVANPPVTPPPTAKPSAPPGPAPGPAPAPAATPAVPKAKSVGKGWMQLDSGLKYKDVKVGTGKTAYSGSQISVHYKGWLDNGKVFDTSRKPGRTPFDLTLDQGMVIPGWDQGIQGMKVGGIRELNIPSDLAYGASGQGEIPPNARLHFTVELLKVD